MSTLNGKVYFKARHPPSITHKYHCWKLAQSPLSFPRQEPDKDGEEVGGRRRIPERIEHETHSAAALTIIKMPRLKGDIPNLRLFVTIKRIPGLLTHSRASLTGPMHYGGGGGGAEGKWKFYPFY